MASLQLILFVALTTSWLAPVQFSTRIASDRTVDRAHRARHRAASLTMLLSGAILLTGPGGVTVPLAFVSDCIRSLEPGLADAAFWWMAMAFLVTLWALQLAGPPCTRLMAGCGAGWPAYAVVGAGLAACIATITVAVLSGARPSAAVLAFSAPFGAACALSLRHFERRAQRSLPA